MQIDRNRFRLLTAVLAASAGAVIGCTAPSSGSSGGTSEVGDSDLPRELVLGSSDDPTDTAEQALMISSSSGYEPPEPTTYTRTTTEDITPTTICGGSLGDQALQKRAGAIFKYLLGGDNPTWAYPCTEGGWLDMTALDKIRGTLAKDVETSKVSNCFFTTTANNCGSGLKAAHHILFYTSTTGTGTNSSALGVVNAMKGLAANADRCWNGAGAWTQPARPNVSQTYEATGTHNFGVSCKDKNAYITKTEVRRTSDDGLISTKYKVSCLRLDPGPAQLTANLNISGNGYAASSVDANVGTSTPYTYSFTNAWSPGSIAAGTPCVSRQFLESQGMYMTTWPAGQYVNAQIQASGSYRRCLTQQ